jgi:hypothetical protein
MQQAASRRVIIMVLQSRSGAGVHPTSLQNTTENMFQNIHRRSLLPALGPARRYPRPRNHRKRTLIRFQTCISCTPCAAAAAAAAAAALPPLASGFKAAAAAAAAARSMSYKSGAPKCRWVGAKDHSLLAGFGISSRGSNYLVVHSDEVSGRWLCQRCC